jgi:hypothetical protein
VVRDAQFRQHEFVELAREPGLRGDAETRAKPARRCRPRA